MRRLPFLLLALLALLLQPIRAQEEEDDGIEVGGCGPEKEKPEDGGYDEEETKKKNVGLAGGGPESDDDVDAPKVQGSLQERINKAIKEGVKWLKKAQQKDGSWGPVRANSVYGQPEVRGDFVRDELGPTAWAVYTLAKCGVKKSDPSISKGLRWIEEQTKEVFDVVGGEAAERDDHHAQKPSRGHPRALTTYESAAIVMMIEAVYEQSAKLTGRHSKRKLESDNPLSPPDRSRIPKDAWRAMHERIVHLTVGKRAAGGGRARGGGGKGVNIPGTQNTQGNNAGGWRYGQANGDADLSSTQFVLLALRAASQAGYPVEKTSPRVWELAAGYVKRCQSGDGGFGYQIGTPSNGSMTACGVSCLIICKEQMELIKQAPPPGIDDAIERGMAWLDERFDATRNPGHEGGHHYYYLYGVERVGDLAGRKEFNAKDWYVRGAMVLLGQQDEDGHWDDATGFQPHDVIGTTFALLFLKRATPPVVTLRDEDR